MKSAAARAVTGRPSTGAPAFPRPAAATVSRVDGTDVYVTLDEAGPGRAFGPCRGALRPVAVDDGAGGHSHVMQPPPAGTSCVVVFAGGSAAQPWVAGYDGWPTGT